MQANSRPVVLVDTGLPLVGGVVGAGQALNFSSSMKNVSFEARNVSSMGAVDFIENTGRLGGQLYNPKKLTQLEGYLARRGIELKVGDEFVPFGKAGGFDAKKW